MKIFRETSFWAHALVLFAVIFILYLPSLHHSFILDDHIGIEQNLNIRSFDTIFSSPISVSRTFMLTVSYLLGQLDPSYYRVMNFIFHFGTVMGVYVMARLLVKDNAAAFFSALIFEVHPILVESVVWISSLTYPQYSFFALLSVIFYILKDSNKKKNIFIGASIVSFLLSLSSSEKAVVVPLIIALYEWLFGSLKKNWKPILFCFLIILSFGVIMFPSVQQRIITFGASAVTGTTDFINPFVQVSIVLGTYLQLIFWPARLTIYHLDELGIQGSQLLLNSVLTLLYTGALIFSYRKNKKIFFFLSIFFIASLPALIPIHVIQIAAERYAYLGTFGIIAATVTSIFYITKRYKVNTAFSYIVLTICAIVLAHRTNLRAQDWESEMSLRSATLKTAPYSARAHNNVGIQLMNEGKDEEALTEYKKAISLKGDYSHPYHNIGHMLALRGRYEEALPFYLKAVELNKYEWKTRQDLGQVYFLLKKYPEAKRELQIAIDQGSSDVQRLRTILNKIEELGY